MVRDFTFKIYGQLLDAMLEANYNPSTYLDYIEGKHGDYKVFVLRHDVDKRPENSLRMAQIQHEKGIKATYYWRIVPESYDEGIIRQVVGLGHELGFHYEDLTLAKGDKRKAIEQFELNLEKFRQFYPVKTICMHGSPFSRWDNRGIWEDHDYRKYGVIAEPYFDTDFNQVFYVSDTGRKWNNTGASVRDKVESSYNIRVDSTSDLIQKLRKGELPNTLMHNVHPQRWNNNMLAWTNELVVQNLKNVVKSVLIRLREK